MDKETEKLIREEIERKRKKERENVIVFWIIMLLFLCIFVFPALVLP